MPPDRTSGGTTLQPARRWAVRDDVAYLLPMGVFLLFTWAGGKWPSLYTISYIAKTLIVAVLLAALWKSFTPIKWNHWWLGAIMGVLVIVQWVGMEHLLTTYGGSFFQMKGIEPFDPTTAFKDPWQMFLFIGIRWAGATLLVPAMEELFWRDFVWRSILAPNNFKLADVGEWSPVALVLTSIIFSIVHVQWATAIVWGLMIGGLLVYTRSLGACIVMHGVTNFLLGAYVLWSNHRGHPHWELW